MSLNFQNEWLLPSLPPFFVLSPFFFFSSVFMLVRLLFRDVSETLPLVYFSCSWFPNPPGTLLLLFPLAQWGKELLCCFWITWILVTGSRWTCPSVVQLLQGCDRAHSSCVSKLLTKAEVCLKSPWLEETQVGMCWTHTPSALPGHLGSESGRWNVRTGEELFTRRL